MLIEAHAKINWTLEVLGKREDGYHELKSIVMTVPLCDYIEIEPGEGVSAADFPYGEKDLAYRAAKRLARLFPEGGVPGARFKVEKRIPAGAGLGGGSADAAAVLKGLNEFWGLNLSVARLCEIGAEIGSDVPALIVGGAVMMEGRGERVRPLTAAESATLPRCEDIVIYTPNLACSTAAVYGEFREGDRHRGRNDLQSAAVRLYPGISAALERLRSQGLSDVAMSGSGSSVYGVKNNEKGNS